ncbi:MAG: hypothetical protein E7554_02405 [Ruminococcaceae bacterium]|nr:hypothetical protein [Oscillospiraceae bacterium]
MNNRRNPKNIMRVFALAFSILLIFSGMMVYYAAEGDEGAAVVTPTDETVVTSTVVAAEDDDRIVTPGDADDEVVTPGDADDDEVVTPGDAPVEEDKCSFCGSENYDAEEEWCDEHNCHEHIADICETCPDCGGCTDSLYGVWCYKDGARCKACSCFELDFLYGYPSHSFTQDEVQDILLTEQNVDLLNTIYVLTGDGKVTSLANFINDSGAKITARTATMDQDKYGKGIFLNVPALDDTENARFSYAFRAGIAAGNTAVIDVSLTVEKDGVSRTVEFPFEINITDGSEDFVKKVELAEGSEKLVIEVGETAEVVYNVTMDDAHRNSFCGEAVNTNDDSVEVTMENVLDENKSVVTIKGLDVGKASIVVSIGEGEDIDGAVDVERRTINVEVVEPSAPAAPGDAAEFSKSVIKANEPVQLEIRGWYDGDDLCYLPSGWTMTGKSPVSRDLPGGGASDRVMEEMLDEDPTYAGLSAGDYTARVTFQEYERRADGWYPVEGRVFVGSAKLKVEAASSGGSGNGGNNTPGGLEKPDGGNGGGNGGNGGNGGTGEGPGTGDFIKENPGVKIAGIVMLIAGLLIFGTLAAERAYREFKARQRQAGAIRR